MKLKDFANWQWLRTAAVWTCITVAALSVVPAYSWVQAVNNHIITSSVVLAQMANVLDLLNIMNRRDLTKRGKGEAGDFGGIAEYVRISSEISSLYTNGDDLRITNLSAIGKPSEVFSIRGEWDPENSEVLVSFSAGASAVFSLEEGEKIKIRIEPVEEK